MHNPEVLAYNNCTQSMAVKIWLGTIGSARKHHSVHVHVQR